MEGLKEEGSLPSVSGDSDASDEELQFQEGCEGDGYPAIFSRGDHIKSLGFYSSEEGVDLELGSLENLEPSVVHRQTVDKAGSSASSEDRREKEPPVQSWEDFKSEFDDVFRKTEDKIASGELDASSSPSPPLAPVLGRDIQNDLIIEMITSLHDSRERESAGKADTEAVAIPALPQAHTLCSPSRPRKQLLSLSNLETIPESDIDRLLESVESRPRTGTDSDFYSLTDSDTTSPSLPTKRVWGLQEGSEGISEGLMKQLYQLSLTQADGHQGLGKEKQSSPTSTGSNLSASKVPVSYARNSDQRKVLNPQAHRIGVASCAGNDCAVATNSPSAGNGRKEGTESATVMIDLRGNEAVDSKAPSSSMEQRYESDESDEEEDDPYTWAQRRKNIKSEIAASAHPIPSSSILPSSAPSQLSPFPLHSTSSHIAATTSIPHHPASSTSHTPNSHANNLHLHNRVSPVSTKGNPGATSIHKHNVAATSNDVADIGHGVAPTNVAATEDNVAVAKQKVAAKDQRIAAMNVVEEDAISKHTVAAKDHSVTKQGVAATEQNVAGINHTVVAANCGVADAEQEAQNSTASQLLQSPTKKLQQSPDSSRKGALRQRSSDSLTMSSSVSDSEITSSEGASCNGEQAKNVLSAGARGKKSKKQAKKSKSKKGQKKSQPVAIQQSKERSEKSLRRRAHVMQRIRNDSWNTSSDEENSLTPLTESSSVDAAFLEEEVVEVVEVDAKKVQADLQKRILSKKPPAPFVTPATDPIYHEDVSFGREMVALHPSRKSSGHLTLPLTQYGLTTLSSSWLSELDMDALVVLHCLVLTWLVHQATIDSSEMPPGQGDEELAGRGGDACGPPMLVKLPFHITGLQQTVLDGQPSLLVAIQGKGARSCENMSDDSNMASSESSNLDLLSENLEAFLSAVTLQSVLQPFLSLPSFSDDIPSSILSSLSRSASDFSLASLFSYHDHITPFTTPVSFYWGSLYHHTSLPSDESLKSASAVNTTVCALKHTSLGNPYLVYTVLSRAFSIGLDLVGVRLLFGEWSGSLLSTDSINSHICSSEIKPVLALALRGPNAVYGWRDVLGPDDNALAKVTDPTSISAVFGSNLVSAMRSPYQSPVALAKWFGGRACLKTGAVFGMSDARTKSERRKRQRVRFSESESEDGMILSPLLPDVLLPPIISNLPRLIAQAYSKSLLVVAPSVPPSCYGSVLASCSELGFDIFGAKRIRLNSKRANALKISSEFVAHFTPSSTPPSPLILDSSKQPPLLGGVVTSVQAPPPLPSVIVIVGRENAALHSATLKRLIMRNIQLLAEKNEHVKISSLSLRSYSPDSIAHLIPYSEERLKLLGSFGSLMPLGSSEVGHVEDDKDCALHEEVCFVAIPGVKSLPACVSLLDKIFYITRTSSTDAASGFDVAMGAGGGKGQGLSRTADNPNEGCEEFELVGMRIVPQLSRFHAKKLCPILVGDSLYSQAVQLLSDKPATLVVFRGISCNKKVLEHVRPTRSAGHVIDLEKRLQFVISRDLPEAVRLTSLFFSGKDLFSDSSSQILTPYLPDSWIHQSDILHGYLHPRETLFSVLWFPLHQLKLAVKVLSRLSRSGFAFAGISTTEVNGDSDVTDKQDGCTAGACIAMCVEKVNAVWLLQHLVKPFVTGGGGGQAKKIECSESFNCAIFDLKRFFPDGVYTQEKPTILRDYNIKNLGEDNFDNLAISKKCLQKLRDSQSSPLLTYISPLMERTVVVLPSSFFSQRGEQQNMDDFVHVLDFFCQSRFDICGMKMVLFSKDSARQLQTILSPCEIELDILVGLPCLVVILERDNAASCFQLIVKSALQGFHSHADADKLMSRIIAPSNAEQANLLLSMFGTC